MNDRLFYGLIISFASGIFIRSLFVFGFAEMLLIALLGLGFLAIARIKKHTVLFFVALVMISFSIGASRFAYSEQKLGESELYTFEGETVTIDAHVSREPDQRETSTLVTLSVSSIEQRDADGLVLLTLERRADIRYGDRVRVSAELRAPETFEGDGGRVFNYPKYLHVRGITHTMSFADVEVLLRDEGNPLFAFLYALKGKFVTALERVLPEPASGFAEGLLLGAKRAIGSDLEHIFRVAGIIHIVVLSGYNITLVAEFVMRLFGFFFSLRARIIAAVISIALFALLVGLSATVVRASVMAVLALIARAFGRTYAMLRALCAAGFLMLIANPYLLVFDPGFELSFLATLGLILLAPKISSVLSFVPARLEIREYASSTIATQIMVLPLLLFSIGTLSVVALPVNLLVLPLIPVAMLLSFIAGLLALISAWIALPVGYIAYAVLTIIVLIAKFFAWLPFSAVLVPAFPFWIVIVLYALLGYVIVRLWRVKTISAPVLALPEGAIEVEVVREPAPEARVRDDQFPFR